jgi:hypothetical protein
VNHIPLTFGKPAGSEILTLGQRIFRQEKRCRKQNQKAAARKRIVSETLFAGDRHANRKESSRHPYA